MHLLPASCTNGQLTWRSDTFLICWEIVQGYYPSRVRRQFGMAQPIPQNVLIPKDLHKMLQDLNRKRNVNWALRHKPYVDLWDARHEFAFIGDMAPSLTASREYLAWYQPRTVKYIVHPLHQPTGRYEDISGPRDVLMEGMVQMYQNFQTPGSTADISHIPQYCMDSLNAGYQLSLDTRHCHFPIPPPPSGTQYHGEPSSHRHSFYQTDTPIPDLNTGTYMDEAGPSYTTPNPEAAFDLTALSPPMPFRDTLSGPAHYQGSPVPYSDRYDLGSFSPSMWESTQPTQQPIRMEEAMPMPDDLMDWGLTLNREPREVRPPAGCLTSDRCYRPREHRHPQN